MKKKLRLTRIQRDVLRLANAENGRIVKLVMLGFESRAMVLNSAASKDVSLQTIRSLLSLQLIGIARNQHVNGSMDRVVTYKPTAAGRRAT